MDLRNEIAIEMRHTHGGKGRETPHLIVSLDCLADTMLENPEGPTQCDVAAVMALVCRAAVDGGQGDDVLALREQRRYEAEARGGEDGDDDVDRLAAVGT